MCQSHVGSEGEASLSTTTLKKPASMNILFSLDCLYNMMRRSPTYFYILLEIYTLYFGTQQEGN